MLKNIAISVVTASVALTGALPVFAQTSVDVAATTAVKVKTGQPLKKGAAATVDVACIQAAVEKRDSAIISAVDVSATSAKSALSTRKEALKAGWAQTEKKARRDALASAWNGYKKSVKSARETLKKSINSAWSTYKSEAKACNGSPEDTTGSGVDATL